MIPHNLRADRGRTFYITGNEKWKTAPHNSIMEEEAQNSLEKTEDDMQKYV